MIQPLCQHGEIKVFGSLLCIVRHLRIRLGRHIMDLLDYESVLYTGCGSELCGAGAGVQGQKRRSFKEKKTCTFVIGCIFAFVACLEGLRHIQLTLSLIHI